MELLITVFKHKKIVAERKGKNLFHVSVIGGTRSHCRQEMQLKVKKLFKAKAIETLH